jgi:hypothetical protein
VVWNARPVVDKHVQTYCILQLGAIVFGLSLVVASGDIIGCFVIGISDLMENCEKVLYCTVL